MTEQGSKKQKESAKQLTLAAFLTDIGPSDQLVIVDDALDHDRGHEALAIPPIELHCSTEACNGVRVFRYKEGQRFISNDDVTTTYIRYLCSNCRRSLKVFSLMVQKGDLEFPAARCAKFGEIPAFGSPTPNRLLRLFGGDSKVFLKGRQCENHGLGIGAFSYYRRVVENHKDQLFDEIIKVAEKIAPETVVSLQKGKAQHQFLAALEAVKDAFPQGLLIDGHNPMTLLHSALSEGLHAGTDEQCLMAAHDIRIVLAALSERMGQALKNEAEVSAAIGRLTSSRS